MSGLSGPRLCVAGNSGCTAPAIESPAPFQCREIGTPPFSVNLLALGQMAPGLIEILWPYVTLPQDGATGADPLWLPHESIEQNPGLSCPG